MINPIRYTTALFLVFSTALAAGPALATGDMARAASGFLSTLSGEQQARATFSFDAEERMRWHFIPSELFPRNGISLGELSGAQRESVQELLRTGLSQRGRMTANAIIELEGILGTLEQGEARFERDPDAYLLTVFGEPERDSTWGWRFEGHHLSLHFTVVAGDITVSTPSFFGANPAEVREGPQQGLRVLGDREDSGRALVNALDAEQRAEAIIDAQAPSDIVTETQHPIDPLSPAGVQATSLDGVQRQLLRELITVYTAVMDEEIARLRWQKIEDQGFDNISFAWAGPLQVGEPHYYRVQGPTFLIEYDNTQNEANHIHSVWRDFDGDFGQDLLQEHYDNAH